ncbi:MAG: hypothetical protein ABIB43_06565, partial [archaeon]
KTSKDLKFIKLPFTMNHWFTRINDESLEKNREFIQTLINENFLGSTLEFDYLNCNESWSRQDDPDMTLETFLENMTDDISGTIMIKTDPLGYKEISLAISRVYLPSDTRYENNKFLWYKTPYAEEKEEKMKMLFIKIYSHRMENAYDQHKKQSHF